MRKSRKRRRRKTQRFETAGTLVLGRALIGRASSAPGSLLRWLRGALLSALIVVAAGALWLAFDDRFYVYRADVVGAVRVSPDEVFRASGLPGLHVLWARPAEIEARLLAALPSLEGAQVSCALPARCKIAVVERQPRVLWDEDGQLWWIDAAGVIFPADVAAGSTAQEMRREGWLVRGPLPRDGDRLLDERVRVALEELWTAGANLPSVLYYVPSRGLVFTDERGWRIVIGRGPGMERRLQVLEWLVADLEARGLTPRFVDVRFAGAPYYSLTNDW
ncbi:MAG: FtsQ-type POTRA domain-containing protein [Gammaproteobacteria bacterium]|nr:FtsQ-type POTRA domain-containing protein [Gammaproteobacteria bacterium]